MQLNPKYYELFKAMEGDLISNESFTKNSNVLMIDGLNTFIRAWSVVPNLSENGEHVGGVVGFLKSIGYAIRELNPTRTIIVFDGRNSSNRKKKIYSDYKANRGKNKLRVNRGIYDQLADEDEEASKRRQIVFLAELLTYLPVTVMLYDSVEADDVMAYMANSLCEEKSVIMSEDGDFLQLVNENCSVWKPTSKVLFTPEKMLQKYGIPSHNFLMYRILEGDKSDNIPGVRGAGAKTIIKRFPDIVSEKRLTIDEMVKYAENKQGKITLYDTLLDSKDILERNYKLMQLHDVDFNGQVKLQVQSRFREDIPPLDKAEFLRAMSREKISEAFRDPIGWLTSTFNTLDSYRK